ncbi:2-succinyl-5-enolpyruvyl-6-hydroxy-3-cyclohexene-1-carboxylic-acid synthase [Streptomyces sp. NPDC127068]|uniref:2-succinyl-5-enolpyruvyl-6-hydroxy-3- cyclohexene-1-carboxylic-acid synthase n=1 Tax=Streptomyces sp. NPDC127068 TaxID=3347127 RepID=UPI00364FA4E0
MTSRTRRAGDPRPAVITPSSALATVFMDELSRCAVNEVVIAPGARSGPLAQAAFTQAGLRHHVRFDERSAGFLALGLAKSGGRPVPVVCTSGTAAANLHPAVLEAHHSRLPLIVLSADRPPELRATGANQSTDQIKLYGDAVTFFAEVGAPELREDSNAYWRTLVCRAVESTASGPVHLNIALRDPLAFTPPSALPAELAGRPHGRPWTRPGPKAGRARPVVFDTGRRGIVVAGDQVPDPAAVVELAEAAGWPLLAEPHSNVRFGANAISTHLDLLTHPATRRGLKPEAVLTVGRPGLSREILALLGSGATHTVVDPCPQWADPTRSASRRLRSLPRPSGRASPDWLKAWQGADRIARGALDDLLDRSGLSEPRVVRDVLRHLPDGSRCLIGSSMPLRDADRTMSPRTGLSIMANRGLSGIDGAVSTAIGMALARRADPAGRAYAVLGDLSFLHDVTGLMLGPLQTLPELVIVVINNNGGGIFSLVDATKEATGFEALFGTPHDARISDLASATAWPHATARTPGELTSLLATPGPRIIEVRTDRAANADFHHQLRRHVHQALETTDEPVTTSPPATVTTHSAAAPVHTTPEGNS